MTIGCFNQLDPEYKIVSPETYYSLLMEREYPPVADELESYPSLIVHEDESLQSAIHNMKAGNRSFALVASLEHEFCGVLSLPVLEQKLLAKRQTTRVADSVAQLMTPKDSLMALKLDELKQITGNDLKLKLIKNQLDYCLIVDSEKSVICGVITLNCEGRKTSGAVRLFELPSYEKILSSLSSFGCR